MSEINMVPLIDVVLVLLVLFILAAPMAAQSVRVNLPKTGRIMSQTPSEAIDIVLTATGEPTTQDGQPLNDTKLNEWLLVKSQTEGDIASVVVRIWSDQDVRYAHLAELIAFIRKAGVTKLSLMTRGQS